MSTAPEKSTQVEGKDEPKQNLLQRIFVRKGFSGTFLVPILAVFTALVIGGFIVAFTNMETMAAWHNFFQDPLKALEMTFSTMGKAYSAMFIGAFGDLGDIFKLLGIWIQTGESQNLIVALRPLGDSLVFTVPYMLAGLGVAVGFQCNLFNIGAEGQLYIGGLASAYVGFAITGLPWYIHAPLTMLAGAVAAGIWGFIPGILKARFGAHEVINTIMMNYIAYRLMDYLLNGPMKSGAVPASPQIQNSAFLASILPSPVRLHWGFFIALGLAYVVYWLLWKTPFGFELRMVGQNDRAARYAGVSVKRTMVWALVISAILCGLAGSIHLMGVDRRMMPSFSPGYGFDAIALALLGNSHPVGVVISSFLFAFLRSGAPRMQVVAGTPVEIIRIIQGMVIVFVAAPEIIRSLYHLRTTRKVKKAAEPGASKA